MKVAKMMITALCGLAFVTSAMAHETEEAFGKRAHDCAKEIAKAFEKEAKQDAKGQAKLDKVLAKFGFPPGTLSYEDSPADLAYEAKLNAKLLKHGCPSQNF